MSRASQQRAKDPNWREYVKNLTEEDKNRILFAAIERLIECEEVDFRQVDDPDDCDIPPEDRISEPYLYWSSCGEDLRRDWE